MLMMNSGDTWHPAVVAQRTGAWRCCWGTRGAGLVIIIIRWSSWSSDSHRDHQMVIIIIRWSSWSWWRFRPQSSQLVEDSKEYFQVPWEQVLRGPDAIDLWLDRIVRWRPNDSTIIIVKLSKLFVVGMSHSGCNFSWCFILYARPWKIKDFSQFLIQPFQLTINKASNFTPENTWRHITWQPGNTSPEKLNFLET